MHFSGDVSFFFYPKQFFTTQDKIFNNLWKKLLLLELFNVAWYQLYNFGRVYVICMLHGVLPDCIPKGLKQYNKFSIINIFVYFVFGIALSFVKPEIMLLMKIAPIQCYTVIWNVYVSNETYGKWRDTGHLGKKLRIEWNWL